jgi:hypothetical protein
MNAGAQPRVCLALLLAITVFGCAERPAAPPSPAATTSSIDPPIPAAPAATQPNAFLAISRGVLSDLFDAVHHDAALSPTADPEVGVNRTDEGAPLSAWAEYRTKDEWTDLPSKFAPGRTTGYGRVSVWLGARRDAELPGFTPLDPPKGCFMQRTVWSGDGPVVKVVIYSMTGDPAAHERLLGIVRAELLKREVTVQ